MSDGDLRSHDHGAAQPFLLQCRRHKADYGLRGILASTLKRGRPRDGVKTPVHALPLLLRALAQVQAALGLKRRRHVTGKMSPE